MTSNTSSPSDNNFSAEDLRFMALALEAARAAQDHDDIPVGAVLVRDGKVLASGKNERELKKSPSSHAEICALELAAQQHGHWNLTGTKLYVTLEPCPMCAGALVQARVAELIYGASDPKGGALSLGIEILSNPKLNHRLLVRQGPGAEESAALLKEFFKKKRSAKKSESSET